MALTYIDYIASGSNTSFSIPFDRLSDSHVKVYLNGTLQAIGYSITGNNVVFSSAPSSGSTVRIRRITEGYNRLVDYTNGSRLDETDLDTDSQQAFYLIQELSDRNETALNRNGAGDFDAGSSKISNVGQPVSNNDAATKTYVDQVAANFTLGTVPDNSITASKLTSNSVTTAKIADGSITSSKIADGAIVTADLADASVTTTKIADSNVTYAKLGSDVTPTLFVPGMIIPYAGLTSPTGWLLCFGQSVSRTTYAALYNAIGILHGAGDGSTTFNLPDLRGRTIAGQDNMGGTLANRLVVVLNGTTTAGSAVITGLSSTAGLTVGMQAWGATLNNSGTYYTIASIDSATQVTLTSGTGVIAGTAQAISFGIVDGTRIGATAGSHIHTLTTPQMPSHTHNLNGTNVSAVGAGAGNGVWNGTTGSLVSAATGGGQAHSNLQPTLILNYLIKT